MAVCHGSVSWQGVAVGHFRALRSVVVNASLCRHVPFCHQAMKYFLKGILPISDHFQISKNCKFKVKYK